MSSSASGPGRPSRPNPETLEKGRRYLELIEYGATVETIVAREGVARSDVYRAMNLARPIAPAGDAPGAQASRIPQRVPKPRKMPAGTLLHRAWIAMRDVRAFELLGAEGREFWVNALMEIRGASDDGVSLTFGPGGMYQSLSEFLTVFPATTPSGLDNLFARGLLVNLDGSGVAMPFRFGLRREPTPEPAAAPAHAGRGAFEVVEGGLSESEETPIYSDSESEDIRINSDSPGGINSDSPAINSDSPRAPSLSLSSSPSFSDSLQTPEESKEGSKRESERARAPASPNKLPANPNASPNLSPNKLRPDIATKAQRSDPPARRTRLPDDWQPPERVLAQIEKEGRDPRRIEAAFRAHYKKKGSTWADWDAAFESWWLKEVVFAPGDQARAGGQGRPEKLAGNGFDRLVLRHGWTGGNPFRDGGAPNPSGNPFLDVRAEEVDPAETDKAKKNVR